MHFVIRTFVLADGCVVLCGFLSALLADLLRVTQIAVTEGPQGAGLVLALFVGVHAVRQVILVGAATVDY